MGNDTNTAIRRTSKVARNSEAGKCNGFNRGWQAETLQEDDQLVEKRLGNANK
jgi:hypothetical protein